MTKKSSLLALSLSVVMTAGGVYSGQACTRVLYETGTESYIVGRSMDWVDNTKTNLWSFPKGMKRDGGVGEGSLTWTSQYGSVIATIYDVATVDGMNEAGLVGNVLYLAESDYGPADTDKPKISVGAWLQYVLDNFATVSEAVDALEENAFTLIAPNLPNGRAATGHVALSDPSGDSAIFEFLDGKLVIHHGPNMKVMTNSPPYDQQLAIDTYWEGIGGSTFLPGTNRAADRFVRATYNLSISPKFKEEREAVASYLQYSQKSEILRVAHLTQIDQLGPNTVLGRGDHKAKRYYYDSVFNPGIFWVDVEKLDLSEGAEPMKLDLTSFPMLSGEVSGDFKPAEPFKFLAP